jgi:hypothetical protein
MFLRRKGGENGGLYIPAVTDPKLRKVSFPNPWSNVFTPRRSNYDVMVWRRPITILSVSHVRLMNVFATSHTFVTAKCGPRQFGTENPARKALQVFPIGLQVALPLQDLMAVGRVDFEFSRAF